MKKIVFFLFLVISSFYNVGPLCAIAEGKVLEGPGEYKKPESYDEAKKEWDKTEENIKQAEKEREEADAERKKTDKRMKKLSSESKEWQDASKIYQKQVDRLNTVDKIKEEWEVRQEELSPLLKKYTEELGQQFEPVVFEEPTWWTRIRKRVNAWFKEQQTGFYSALGNNAKIIEIRQDLTKVYADLGTGGLLDKARNTKKLSIAFKDLGPKIGKGVEALIEYQEAFDKGAVSEKEKETIQGEIREVVTDLIELREQLKREGVDVKIRETITNEIDTALDAFGIPKEVRVKIELEQGALLDRTENQIATIPELIRKNPLEFTDDARYKTFIEDVRLLEEVDVTKLSLFEAADIKATINRSYDTVITELAREIYTNPDLSQENRDLLAARFLNLRDKANEVDNLYSKAFDTYRQAGGRVPSKEQLGPVPPLAKGYAENREKVFSPLKDELVADLKKPDIRKKLDREIFTKKYENLNKAIDNELKMIQNAPVSPEKLNVLRSVTRVYDEIYIAWNEELPKQGFLASREYTEIMLDILTNMGETDRLENRFTSVLAQQKGQVAVQAVFAEEGPEVYELFKAYKQPENMEAYNEQRRREKEQAYKAELSPKQSLLRYIKYRGAEVSPIPEPGSPEDKRFREAFKGMAERTAKTGAPLAQPEWWVHKKVVGPPPG